MWAGISVEASGFLLLHTFILPSMIGVDTRIFLKLLAIHL